jgi:hypothetical protein
MAHPISLPTVGTRRLPDDTPKYIPLGDEYAIVARDKGAIVSTIEAFVTCVNSEANMYVAVFKDIDGEYAFIDFHLGQPLLDQFDNWPKIRRVILDYPSTFEGVARMPQIAAVQAWNGTQQCYVECVEFRLLIGE